MTGSLQGALQSNADKNLLFYFSTVRSPRGAAMQPRYRFGMSASLS
jgi:hypothetical protein